MASEADAFRAALEHDRRLIQSMIGKQCDVLFESIEVLKLLKTARVYEAFRDAHSEIHTSWIRLKKEIARPHWTETLTDDSEQP